MASVVGSPGGAIATTPAYWFACKSLEVPTKHHPVMHDRLHATTSSTVQRMLCCMTRYIIPEGHRKHNKKLLPDLVAGC